MAKSTKGGRRGDPKMRQMHLGSRGDRIPVHEKGRPNQDNTIHCSITTRFAIDVCDWAGEK